MGEVKIKNQNNPENLIIDFDPKIYSLKAIKNAAYDFMDRAVIRIESLPSGQIRVYMASKPENVVSTKSLAEDFQNHVLDHQIRIEVGEDYGVIREMIVAQAFEPCENINEITDQLKL